MWLPTVTNVPLLMTLRIPAHAAASPHPQLQALIEMLVGKFVLQTVLPGRFVRKSSLYRPGTRDQGRFQRPLPRQESPPRSLGAAGTNQPMKTYKKHNMANHID
jgi:hypothetical protein